MEPPQRRKSLVKGPTPTAAATPQHDGSEDSDENCGVDLDGVDIAAVEASINNDAPPGVITCAAATTPQLTPNVFCEPEPVDAADVAVQFVTKLLDDANCLSPLHRFWRILVSFRGHPRTPHDEMVELQDSDERSRLSGALLARMTVAGVDLLDGIDFHSEGMHSWEDLDIQEDITSDHAVAVKLAPDVEVRCNGTHKHIPGQMLWCMPVPSLSHMCSKVVDH